MQILTLRDLREMYGGQCYYVPIVDETGGANDPVAVKISDTLQFLLLIVISFIGSRELQMAGVLMC